VVEGIGELVGDKDGEDVVEGAAEGTPRVGSHSISIFHQLS